MLCFTMSEMDPDSTTETVSPRTKLLRSSAESYGDVVVVRKISRRVRLGLGVSVAANVIFLCALMWLWTRTANTLKDPSLGRQWSPANEAIAYKEVIFDSSVQNDRTPYQGAPNPENNALWHGLYDEVGISQILVSSASKLEIPSSPVPGHEDQHYIQLDVFHHLHCLNMIRLMLWHGNSPESLYLNAKHLGDTEEERMGHVDHCVDQIRQYIMCHADTTPLVWQWSEKNKKYLTYVGMKHTCRDWDKLYEWAQEHRSHWDYDRDKYVPGSPEWGDTKARVKWMKHIPGEFNA